MRRSRVGLLVAALLLVWAVGCSDEQNIEGGDPCSPNPCTTPFQTKCNADGSGGYTCGCDDGFSVSEFGTCFPKCTNTTEVCNARDDDCDGKIDEDDICVIDPTKTKENTRRPILHTTTIQWNGISLEVAHDRVSVVLKSSAIASQTEQAALLAHIKKSGAKVIGKTAGAVTLEWQLAVNNPSQLKATRDKIASHASVQRASLSPIMDFIANVYPQPDITKKPGSGGWWIEKTDAHKAWGLISFSKTDTGTPIGIADSGLQLKAAAMLAKQPKDPICIDENKHCTGDGPGWHGTRVASLAAGRGDDGEGAVGVAWDCPITMYDLTPGYIRKFNAKDTTKSKCL